MLVRNVGQVVEVCVEEFSVMNRSVAVSSLKAERKQRYGLKLIHRHDAMKLSGALNANELRRETTRVEKPQHLETGLWRCIFKWAKVEQLWENVDLVGRPFMGEGAIRVPKRLPWKVIGECTDLQQPGGNSKPDSEGGQ